MWRAFLPPALLLIAGVGLAVIAVGLVLALEELILLVLLLRRRQRLLLQLLLQVRVLAAGCSLDVVPVMHLGPRRLRAQGQEIRQRPEFRLQDQETS